MPLLKRENNTTAIKKPIFFMPNHTPNFFERTAEPGVRRIRLDKWLHGLIPEMSRTRLQGWFAEGRITLNGRPMKAGELVHPGATYRMEPPPESGEDDLPAPMEMPLEIVYEDGALLVVNKAAGVVVHPAPGHKEGTLIQGLLYRYPDLEGVGEPHRPGLVHRLDAETSGLLVFARTEEALACLQHQFRERETAKTYQALVAGMPLVSEGRVDEPLGRHPQDRKRRAVDGLGAREARTAYRLLRGLAGGRASWMEVDIETGRTHQIRVHMAHIGHPVLGDKLYGGRRAQLPAPWPKAERHMLHAFRLRLRHPHDKRELEFEAPLPPDLQSYLHALQSPCP